MQDRKFKVGYATYPYAGNGSTKAENPALRKWFHGFMSAVERDPRCESEVFAYEKADTPIPMLRNETAYLARKAGVDVLVMFDSDMEPDLYLGYEPRAAPFWQTAFNFFVDHYDRGPCMAFAPYCGPPAHPITGGSELPYVFKWCAPGNTTAQKESFQLSLFSREEAQGRTGIEKVAAGPTGLILYDMRMFGDPLPEDNDKLAEFKRESDRRGWWPLPPPWFAYEYGNQDIPPVFEASKASTEDVFVTRNAGLAGIPSYCLWDCWAGHGKAETVGKPQMFNSDQIHEHYRRVASAGLVGDAKSMDLRPAESTEEVLKELGVNSEEYRQMQDEADFDALHTKTDGDGFVHVGIGSVKEDMEVLTELVKRAAPDNRAMRVVEVGSWVGASALVIDRAIPKERERTICCVDTWEGSEGDPTLDYVQHYGTDKIFETFKQNLGNFRNVFLPIKSHGVVAAHQFRNQDQQFDLVFIDADHRYEAVKADIEAWWPLVRPGGILCGHDYCNGRPGVEQAVHEFRDSTEGFDLEDRFHQRSMWWFEKPQVAEKPLVTTERYSPMPVQEKFHASDADLRILTGGNRSGKSTALFAEVAKIALRNPCTIWVFVYDEEAIGRTVYRRLFESGFIHESHIKRFDWIREASRIFRSCLLENGTLIQAAVTGATPEDSGETPNFIAIDDSQLTAGDFAAILNETNPGTTVAWAVWPVKDAGAKGQELLKLMGGNSEGEEFRMLFEDNIHIEIEARKETLQAWRNQSEDVLVSSNGGSLLMQLDTDAQGLQKASTADAGEPGASQDGQAVSVSDT